MAFQLDRGETVVAGIQRIIREQIDQALAELRGETENSRDEAVHEARKCFKRIRAVLRLVRPELELAVYKAENICFRDVGRQLSDIRDAQVRIETLDKLMQRDRTGVDPKALDAVRKSLESAYETAYQQVLQERDAIPSVITTLETARERVAQWTFQHEDWLALQSGFRQTYRAGRQRFAIARQEPTAEMLHEWRKQVKHLWYQLLIIGPIWPGPMKALAEEAHKLSDHLGDDHDLAVLHEFVVASGKSAPKGSSKALLKQIDRRRAKLQLAANQLGHRLYAESTRSFVDRLEHYWQAWQAEK